MYIWHMHYIFHVLSRTKYSSSSDSGSSYTPPMIIAPLSERCLTCPPQLQQVQLHQLQVLLRSQEAILEKAATELLTCRMTSKPNSLALSTCSVVAQKARRKVQSSSRSYSAYPPVALTSFSAAMKFLLSPLLKAALALASAAMLLSVWTAAGSNTAVESPPK